MPDSTSVGPGRRNLSLDQYETGVRNCDAVVLARALTLVESENSSHRELAEQLLTRLLPYTGTSIRVGITGSPGVGKSTFIEALGLFLTDNGHRVAVLAVDPSSGISGGSILGDKTRMHELATRPNAFIRPAPSAGTLGGVACRTRESLLVCEAAGYDIVLVETVGVGQSETMVADMTDCFLALMQPGAGDELQGIKRGLLEIVDVVAVNKADGEGRLAAEKAAHQYDMALRATSPRSARGNPPQVFLCSALQQEGVEQIWQAIEQDHQLQQNQGTLVEKRGKQNLRWLWELVEQRVRVAITKHAKVDEIRDALEAGVVAGAIPPETAARQILAALGLSEDGNR
ncbi:MAG: methylmalonyl Co-A mutase-associated GTPase MeaB [Bythopirellula sp.]